MELAGCSGGHLLSLRCCMRIFMELAGRSKILMKAGMLQKDI